MSVKGDGVFMRLFVFFDLPVTKKSQRKIATRFRNDLLKDGYHMLQFSVYCRICKGQDVVERQMRRLEKIIPKEGNIRILQVTDKQYARMKLILGYETEEEKLGVKQLVLL